MTQVVRIATLALVLAALLGGLVGTTDGAAAANGYEQWTEVDAAGCTYLWDGYAYTAAICGRADGGFDYYGPGDGVWVYVFSDGTLADGTYWIYYNGAYAYSQTSTASNDPTGRSIYDLASGTIGGTGSGGGVTDQPYDLRSGTIGGAWSNENMRLAEIIANGGSSADSTYMNCLTTAASVDWDYSGRIEPSEVSNECSRREGN